MPSLLYIWGSSPRMRGAHRCTAINVLRVGIIPADAGSTDAGRSGCERGVDHPRGCGEHANMMVKVLSMAGSSPRMRGAHAVIVHVSALDRIIPADAGSTDGGTTISVTLGDHPRGCGEHYGWPGGVDLSEGSSPRMRGAQFHVL